MRGRPRGIFRARGEDFAALCAVFPANRPSSPTNNTEAVDETPRSCGTAVAKECQMSTHGTASRSPRAESAAMLGWDFLRGRKAVTCEERATGRSLYDVCVVPLGDVSSSVVERFAHPVAALRRHAQIASDFQEAGFSVSRTRRRCSQD